MATYTWNGTGFNESIFVQSQFMLDAGGYLWYYDQNYNGFFPAVLVSGGPVYQSNGYGTQANGQPFNLPTPNVLTSQDTLLSYAASFGVSVVAVRQQNYVTTPSNTLNAVLQPTTALVNNDLTNALSANQGLQTAINTATPYLTDPNLNFALNDVATGWNGGQQTIMSLQSIVNNHAANIASAMDAVQRLADFKRKIILQVTNGANSIRSLQGQTATFQSQNTFTTLTSAFPASLGPLNSVFSNQNAFLQSQLASYLPGQTSSTSGIMASIFGGISGSVISPIMNPVDKIIYDLDKLEGSSLNSLNGFPVAGFGSLGAQTSYVNQVANVLNNIVATFATPSVIPTSGITNGTNILAQMSNYVAQQLGQPTPNTPTITLTQAVSATSGTYVAATAISTGTDPISGGTFANLPLLAANLPTGYNLSIPQPQLTVSPDPTIVAAQNASTVAATNASEATAIRNAARGDCINNISDVPLKPRSQPLDGSMGNYNGSKSIPY